jgi:hypothetical protein
VFLQLRWIIPFETKWAFLHLENYDSQEAILSKSNTILNVQHLLHVSASKTDGFFDKYLCAFNFPVQAYLDQTDPISTLYPISSRKFSFQNLTPFSHENHVLDAPAYNIDGVLYRDTYVSSS